MYDKISKHFTDILTDEDKELFTDCMDTHIKFLSICNADSFIAGFILGAWFTYDTLITYSRDRDYFIPNLKLKETENKTLGKYGRMRRDYLKNHGMGQANDIVSSMQSKKSY